MRLLLDLREIRDPEKRRRLAAEADENGIWGVVVTGPRGGESVEASVIATATTNITIAVDVDIDGVHCGFLDLTFAASTGWTDDELALHAA